MKKKIRATAHIVAVAGFILILGCIGNSDAADAAGEFFPIWKTLSGCGMGLTMMAPCIIMTVKDEM